jgi:hypothetical protein
LTGEGITGKELHFFDRFVRDEFTPADIAHYRSRFGSGQGEFTPGYLRCPWVPELVQRAAPGALLIVLLRDPVERALSALRWHAQLPPENERSMWSLIGSDATWGGMYAAQLRLWSRVVPKERIHVEQYERAVADPQLAASKIWTRLGLDSVEIGESSERSETSTTDDERSAELRPHLRSLYGAELEQLTRDWAIDPLLWGRR